MNSGAMPTGSYGPSRSNQVKQVYSEDPTKQNQTISLAAGRWLLPISSLDRLDSWLRTRYLLSWITPLSQLTTAIKTVLANSKIVSNNDLNCIVRRPLKARRTPISELVDVYKNFVMGQNENQIKWLRGKCKISVSPFNVRTLIRPGQIKEDFANGELQKISIICLQEYTILHPDNCINF